MPSSNPPVERRTALHAALTRDELLELVVVEASHVLEGARVFSVHGRILRGQVEVGPSGEPQRAGATDLRLELDATSLLGPVVDHGVPFFGTVGADDKAATLVEAAVASGELLVAVPVRVRDRTPCVIAGRVAAKDEAAARRELARLAEETANAIAALILRARDHTVSFRLPDFLPEEIAAIHGAAAAETILARALDASRRYLAEPEAYSVTAREIRGRVQLVDGEPRPLDVRVDRSVANVLGRVCDTKLFHVGPVASGDPYLEFRTPLSPREKLVVVPVGRRRVAALIVGRVDGAPSARMREALEGLAHEAHRALVRLARDRATPSIPPRTEPVQRRRRSWLAVIGVAVALLTTMLLFRQDVTEIGTALWSTGMEIASDLLDALTRLRRGDA